MARTARKIQRAAIEVLLALEAEGRELPRTGEALTFDVRCGDEGEGSWTRVNNYPINADLVGAIDLEMESLREQMRMVGEDATPQQQAQYTEWFARHDALSRVQQEITASENREALAYLSGR